MVVISKMNVVVDAQCRTPPNASFPRVAVWMLPWPVRDVSILWDTQFWGDQIYELTKQYALLSLYNLMTFYNPHI